MNHIPSRAFLFITRVSGIHGVISQKTEHFKERKWLYRRRTEKYSENKENKEEGQEDDEEEKG
jgi:hypothetical protein